MTEYYSICVVTQPLSAIGETTTASLLEILSEFATVTLITANLGAESELREQYDVVEVSSKDTGDNIVIAGIQFLLNQLRMATVTWRRSEETILFFGGTSYFLPIVAAKLSRKTAILEPRGDVPLTLRIQWSRRMPESVARWLARAVWLLERTGFWIADAIITYTPGVADQLGLERFHHKLYTEGARYVGTDMFYPWTPFENRERVVGFLGRLDEEKGIRTLAEVAKRLPDDVTVRFIGDGDLRGWLEGEMTDEIEAGRAEVVGRVDHNQVPEELSRMRLLVLLSEMEGLPTVMLEAMACGTPVLATPVGGVPDVVRDGATGVLVSDTAPAAIAAQITATLARDDLPAMSHAARERMLEAYTVDAAVARYRRILTAVSPQ